MKIRKIFNRKAADPKAVNVSRAEFEREIEERKQAEEALRQAVLRYRTVADNTYDFEFWLDPEGKFLYASPSCLRIYGRKPEEFLADPGLRRNTVHPDDLTMFDRHLAEEAGKVWSEIEFRILRPDGTYRWIGHVCQPVFDESGRYLGIRGSNRDATERKKAEEELLRLNRELRAISECNQVIVRATDEQALFKDVCRIMCEVVGYRMAWVGLVEHDDAKSVRPVAWGGAEDGYLADGERYLGGYRTRPGSHRV